MLFEPLINNFPEYRTVYEYILIWLALDLLYFYILFIGETNTVSSSIKDTYNDMTKIGLIIMKPITFFIIILEFGGLILGVIAVSIDFWFILMGVVIIAFIIHLFHKIIYKKD